MRLFVHERLQRMDHTLVQRYFYDGLGDWPCELLLTPLRRWQIISLDLLWRLNIANREDLKAARSSSNSPLNGEDDLPISRDLNHVLNDVVARTELPAHFSLPVFYVPLKTLRRDDCRPEDRQDPNVALDQTFTEPRMQYSSARTQYHSDTSLGE